MQGKRPVVEMQAEATGIHRDGPDARPEYFLYNIGTQLPWCYLGSFDQRAPAQRACVVLQCWQS